MINHWYITRYYKYYHFVHLFLATTWRVNHGKSIKIHSQGTLLSDIALGVVQPSAAVPAADAAVPSRGTVVAASASGRGSSGAGQGHLGHIFRVWCASRGFKVTLGIAKSGFQY